MNITNTQNLNVAQMNATNAKQDGLLAGVNPNASPAAKVKKIKQLAADFEAIFTGIMLKSMRASIQKTGLVDGGNAEDIYRSMLDQEYSKQMADQSQSGLAKNIEDYLLESSGLGPQAAKNRIHQTYGAEALQKVAKKAKIVE